MDKAPIRYTKEDVDRLKREIREWTDNDIGLHALILEITGASHDSEDNPLNYLNFNEGSQITDELGAALTQLLITAIRATTERGEKRLAQLLSTEN